jgi:hypothetical protein
MVELSAQKWSNETNQTKIGSDLSGRHLPARHFTVFARMRRQIYSGPMSLRANGVQANVFRKSGMVITLANYKQESRKWYTVNSIPSMTEFYSKTAETRTIEFRPRNFPPKNDRFSPQSIKNWFYDFFLKDKCPGDICLEDTCPQGLCPLLHLLFVTFARIRGQMYLRAIVNRVGHKFDIS